MSTTVRSEPVTTRSQSKEPSGATGVTPVENDLLNNLCTKDDIERLFKRLDGFETALANKEARILHLENDSVKKM